MRTPRSSSDQDHARAPLEEAVRPLRHVRVVSVGGEPEAVDEVVPAGAEDVRRCDGRAQQRGPVHVAYGRVVGHERQVERRGDALAMGTVEEPYDRRSSLRAHRRRERRIAVMEQSRGGHCAVADEGVVRAAVVPEGAIETLRLDDHRVRGRQTRCHGQLHVVVVGGEPAHHGSQLVVTDACRPRDVHPEIGQDATAVPDRTAQADSHRTHRGELTGRRDAGRSQ